MAITKIEWAHYTANLWWGCTRVHEGCDNCYAEALSNRWGNDVWGNDKPRKLIAGVWNDLAKYQKLAAEASEVHRVFVGSMMDIFEKPMQMINSKGEMATDGVHYYPVTTDQQRDQLFEEITEGKYPNLLFLLLTKRPSNISKYIPESWKRNPPENVMFGTSVVNQATANTLIPQLLKVIGKKFLSCEPLLGPINLTEIKTSDERFDLVLKAGLDEDFGWLPLTETIDWVIVGGESGHGARPMHPEWVRSIRDQCKMAGVAFFFKQWGEYAPHMDGPRIKKVSVVYNGVGYEMCKVGKKAAGRLLDGRTHDEFPFFNNVTTK